jgi:hypothetical protein
VTEPVFTPNRIQDILDNLAICLCSQILDDNLPGVCFCGIMPGEDVALDYVGDCDDACGQAWVRLATAYPSVTVGQPSQGIGNCNNAIGLEIELGIVRCFDVGDGRTPVDPVELGRAGRLQIADMLAMWRAVACCNSSKDFIMGQYVPIGPQGGIVGGTLPLGILVT